MNPMTQSTMRPTTDHDDLRNCTSMAPVNLLRPTSDYAELQNCTTVNSGIPIYGRDSGVYATLDGPAVPHSKVSPHIHMMTPYERSLICGDLTDAADDSAIDGERDTYRGLSSMALNNGTPFSDLEQDWENGGYTSEEEIKAGKKKLAELLDLLLLKEMDQREALRLNEGYVYANMSTADGLKRRAKNAGRFMLTAVPKFVDAILPISWQTTPKLQMIESLRDLRENMDKDAERCYQDDIARINSKYEAIRDYALIYYADVIPAFNANDPEAVENFLNQCLEDAESLHYKNVQNIVKARVEERDAQFEVERANIAASSDVDADIREIRESSWLLRGLDKVKNTLSSWKDRAELFYVTNFGKPALQAHQVDTGAINSTVSGGRGSSMGTVGGGHGGNRTADAMDGPGGPKQPTGRAGKWGARLAAALALLTAGYIANDASKNGCTTNEDNGNVSALLPVGDADVPDEGSGVPIAGEDNDEMNEPAEDLAINEPDKVVPEDTNGPETTPAVKPAPSKGKAQTPVYVSPVPRAAAKSIVTPKQSPTDINPTTTIEPTLPTEPGLDQLDTPQETKDLTLTEEQKLTELRVVEAKVAAYQKRVTNIQRDVAIYGNLERPGQEIDGRLQHTTKLLDKVMTIMRNLDNQSQLDQIDATLKDIDQVLAAANFWTVSVNVGLADAASVAAKDLLKKTHELSEGRGPRFTLVHNDQVKKSVTAYDVNIPHIQARIDSIHAQRKNTRLTLEEARLLQKDAQYWVGYLQFVNWYLQHNPDKISAQK